MTQQDRLNRVVAESRELLRGMAEGTEPSKTPRTDDHAFIAQDRNGKMGECVTADFARELEVSLSETQSALDTLIARDEAITIERDRLKEDLSAARQSLYEVAAQRNELHATLQKLSIDGVSQ